MVDGLFSSKLFRLKSTFCWHAGEPLVVPPERYRSFLRILRTRDAISRDIVFNFQTNGTLLSQRWCDFIGESGSSITISVDGPRHLHNKYRVDRAGAGTYEQTIRGIEFLKKNNIAFNCICVLGREHLCAPDEVYSFFSEISPCSAKLNMQELEGENSFSSWSDDEVTSEFSRFAYRIIELNEKSGKRIRFDTIYAPLLASNIERSQEATPWDIVTIDVRGNVVTFSPELLSAPAKRFVLGNIRQTTLDEMANTEYFARLATEVESGVRRCRAECSYFRWCGGGAPSNKFFENGTMASTETYFCRNMRKAILEVNFAYASGRIGLQPPG